MRHRQRVLVPLAGSDCGVVQVRGGSIWACHDEVVEGLPLCSGAAAQEASVVSH